MRKESEYIFRNESLLRPPCANGDANARLGFYGDLADEISPMMLPFVLRPEIYGEVPWRQLGLSVVLSGSISPQLGEVWVLFCFRREKRLSDSVFRTDGFPLILEWRKDILDSPLLSSGFHCLAKDARKLLKIEGYGLCPSFQRYGDKIDFTDAELFSDKDHVANIASAFGALIAGLQCAASGKYPSKWPFPTVQWDMGHGGALPVAGLAQKIRVAADFGAETVTVAKGQAKEAREMLGALKRESTGRFGSVKLHVVDDTHNPIRFAANIAYGFDQKRRIVRIVAVSLSALLLIMSLGIAYGVDARSEKIRYFKDYVERDGVAEGIYPVQLKNLSGRWRTYRFHFRGYDSLLPWKRRKVLRAVWCVRSDGGLALDVNDYPEHRTLCGWEYEYNEQGCVSEIKNYGAGRRLLDTYRCSGRRASAIDVIDIRGDSVVASFLNASNQGDAMRIRHMEFVRDEDGFAQRIKYFRDSSGAYAGGENKMSMIKMQRDTLGRITNLRYFDWQERPIANVCGVHEKQYGYEDGRLTSVSYKDVNGGFSQLASGQSQEECYQYDANDNVICHECLRCGQTIRVKTYSYDDQSGVQSDEAICGAKSIHRYARYDRLGNVKEVREFDALGVKVVTDTFYEYDREGLLTEVRVCDTIGRLKDNDDGWAIRKLVWHENNMGHSVERSYYDHHERGVLSRSEKIGRDVKQFDANGRLVAWRLFGVQNNPICGVNGWHRAVFSYGHDGNITEITLFDDKELPITPRMGDGK